MYNAKMMYKMKVIEVRRMQREEERERRRLRDRERRQSMTQEQRERHLERRRRNYQLRRLRAANNNTNANIYNMPQPPQSTTAEATTSDEHPTLLSSSISDYTTTTLHLHQQTSNFGTPNLHGSSVHTETLAYTPTKKLRLNHIRHIARTLRNIETKTAQVAPELIAMGKADLTAHGSTLKSLRLKRVKQLARSLHSPSKESLAQNQNGTEVEHNNITFPTYINLG